MKQGQIIINLAKGVYKRTGKLFNNPFKKVGFDWLTVRKLKNLPEQTLHTIPFLGKEVSFQSRDEFLHSIEEIFIGEIYKQQLGPTPYIIDCGANIGLSVIYMKQLYPEAIIVAFEPDDTNFSLLKKNTEAFGFENVELRKEAVWIESTTLKFQSEGSLMSRIGSETAQARTIDVQATRLKDLVNKEIGFLKIDIEGAEYKVLKDIEENLQYIQNLFIEYHGTFAQNNELNDIFQLITNAGFHYYVREAIDKHPTPFVRTPSPDYDVQLNIFCFR